MESNASEPSSHVDPDVLLMLRVRDDDAVAFEMLVSRFQGRIGRLMLVGSIHRKLPKNSSKRFFFGSFAREKIVPTDRQADDLDLSNRQQCRQQCCPGSLATQRVSNR